MPKVTSELLENREVQLIIEVERPRVERALKKAARKISRSVNIPGFRKGKAPYHVIVSQFGEGALYDEALDSLGQEVYGEALEESDLEPYAPATLKDVKLDPMVLTFNVPLRPEIDLGTYRDVRVERSEVSVDSEEVEEALQVLQAQQALLEPVERAIELGDVATLDLKGTVAAEENEEAETLVDREGAAVLITEDASYPLPGFWEKVLGMESGEERSFTISIEDDELFNEELLGKEVHFDVKCLKVQHRDLPELDDEFAQSVGDFENMEALKEDIRNDLQEHKQHHEDEEYATRAIEAILENATLDYPPIMIEEWIDRRVQDFERSLQVEQNLSLEDYFSITNNDEDKLREEFRESAESSLRHALVLGKLVDEEKVAVEEDEIDDEIKTRLLAAGQQAALAQHLFNTPAVKNEIRDSLLARKAHDRLIAIASGNAPPLEDASTEASEEETLETDDPADKLPVAEDTEALETVADEATAD